jgi:two-component system, OmpR family, alkaline phosphatase synthesis response regulator PhoP
MATSDQTGSTAAAHAPRSSRVLVVDDNPQNQELLAAYLETMGVEVRMADDGVTALQQVAADPPDLILLDIMMPRMSGFEVCTKLKSDPATRDIPVIMVTALDRMADIQRAVDCGTDDFLSRPLSRLELVTRVKNLLKVRHLKNELDRTLEYLSEIEKRPSSSS